MSHKPPRKKVGHINMQKTEKGMMKKWKSYRFSVTAIYLLYFKAESTNKPSGQILLTSITKVETNAAKGASYPLQVHFRGKAEQGPNSPWVLDVTSNDERIQWMEAILPGSSEPLLRFTKSGSLRQATPLSPQSTLSYNPYSLAEHDPSVGNGSPQNSLWQNVGGSTSVEPLNYMEPVASAEQHEEQVNPVTQSEFCVASESERAQSKCVPRSSHVIGSRSADASFKTSTNPRQASNRSTISHLERDKDHTTSHLARSNTERVATKSPEHGRVVTKSPEHVYELDPVKFAKKVQPPPVPKPRVKRPPPTNESYIDSSAVSRSLNESDLRLATRSRIQADKDAEFEYPEQSPATRGQSSRSISSDTSPVPKPDQKPPITPRKTKSVPQPEYLSLSSDASGGSGLNGSAGDRDRPDISRFPSGDRDRPDISRFPQEMIKNFSPNQLDMLITMLQQVQIDGQQPAYAPPSIPQRPVTMEKKFERVVSYTPELQTDKILVTDEDDSEGYEARPDWAKAVSKRATDPSSSEQDTLSGLQEEALCIPRSRLTNFTEIGEGQFGKVFRAMLQRGSEPVSVAVKTAKKSTSTQAEFFREMNIMSQMMHPNIVQLYGIIKDDVPAPWIVLEYLHNGDIKNFLMENKRPVEKLVKYMLDVSMGMHYLSERGLVHRDLAARNVLVGENETCKVSDFGLLRELPKDDTIYHMQTNVPCPVRWMPPESISDRNFSPASDVWSFGILQWEMFHPEKTPYEKLGNIEVAMKIMKGHRLEVPPSCPAVVGRIMKACWHQNPDKRPSFLLISTLLTTKVTFPST